MRTTIAIATFLAIGAGAAGVTAAQLDVKGSDTLKDLTKTILGNATLDCGGVGNTPAGSLSYLGTGSGNGESAMNSVTPTQQVAPMSRFLNVNAANCTASNGGTTAEGIVFALDGISIVAGKTNTAVAACNGSEADCDPNTSPNAGLAFNKLLPTSGYQLVDWRDTLRVLYMGVDHSAVKDCRSPARVELVGSWGAVFQDACPTGTCTSAAGGNTTAGTVCRNTVTVTAPGISLTPADCVAADVVAIPNGIQHLFRRNDESGTSDVFVTLLQAAGGTGVRNTILGGTGTTNALFDANAGFDEFCGTRPVASIIPLPPKPRATAPADPPFPLPTGAVPGGTFNAAITPFFADEQDWDPIRRVCAGTQTEDGCSARGDLGIVLPIWDAPANTFTVSPCLNKFLSKPGVVIGSVTPAAASCPPGSGKDAINRCIVCPDGGPLTNGSCLVPVDAANSALCNSTRLTTTPLHAVVDGRVQNLWARNTAGTIVTSARGRTTGGSDNVPMIGAYYRLHQAHAFTGRPTCQKTSATDAIGCLVDASPCSMGYAGRTATDPSINANTAAMKVNHIDPLNLCIQDVLNLVPPALPETRPALYPLSRKLFLNTLVGFENLPGAFANGADELKLAQCFGNPAVAETLASATNGITGAAGLGFVPLPGTIAVPGTTPTEFIGNPFCQDFHESGCPGATNPVCTTDVDCTVAGTFCFNPTGAAGAGKCETDACTNNPTGVPTNEAP